MSHPVLETIEDQLSELLELVCLQLQLPDSLFEKANTSYQHVGEWLSAHDSHLAIDAPVVFPQGSMALRTTVKPRAREEFDVDGVCVLQRDRRADPTVVFSDVVARLKQHQTFGQMMRTESRCITLNYQAQYRLEIVPAVPDPISGGTALLIPDRSRQSWIPTDPKGYASWFETQSLPFAERRIAASVEPLPSNQRVREKTVVQRIVQLVKRRRDVQLNGRNDSIRSIVLTTLCAENYRFELGLIDALEGVLRRIEQSIRAASPSQLVVPCPTNSDENLASNWCSDLDHYREFVHFVLEFQIAIQEIKRQRSLQRVTAMLKRLFDPDSRGIVEQAVRAYTEKYAKAREQGRIRLVPKSSVLTTCSSPSHIPIPKNTFYGDRTDSHSDDIAS
jgi:hypothetical protein